MSVKISLAATINHNRYQRTSTSAISSNYGYETHRKLFDSSQWVYFCINLHTDMTTLRKYIPPNVKITMEFQRNSGEFYLLPPNWIIAPQSVALSKGVPQVPQLWH